MANSRHSRNALNDWPSSSVMGTPQVASPTCREAGANLEFSNLEGRQAGGAPGPDRPFAVTCRRAMAFGLADLPSVSPAMRIAQARVEAGLARDCGAGQPTCLVDGSLEG
jgi:hypothetical protein